MSSWFLSDCETCDAPAAPPVFASGQPESNPPLPRPLHRARQGNFQGFLDRGTVQNLAISSESGAALEAVAPVLSAETGAPRGNGSLAIPAAVLLLAYLFF